MNLPTYIIMGEDASCTTPCYLDANLVYMSKKPIYLYTVRGDSITTSFKISQISEVGKAVEYLRNLDVKKPDYFEELLARYSCFLCFAILAAAAEGEYFSEIKGIKKAILGSIHSKEIKKAYFENITLKSKITVFLLKKEQIRLAFYFLYICKKIKDIKKGLKK